MAGKEEDDDDFKEFGRSNKTSQSLNFAHKVARGKLKVEDVPPRYREEVDYLLHATDGDLSPFFPFSIGAMEGKIDKPRERGSTETRFS